jgi:hypothetical protein
MLGGALSPSYGTLNVCSLFSGLCQEYHDPRPDFIVVSQQEMSPIS